MSKDEGQPTPYAELIAILDEVPVIVRHTRRQRGLSVRAAGREAGLSFMTISRVENGQKDMDAETLRALLAWVSRPIETAP